MSNQPVNLSYKGPVSHLTTKKRRRQRAAPARERPPNMRPAMGITANMFTWESAFNSLFFFVFFSLSSCYCISSLFFIEEEVNDDTWRKEHFLGKNSSLSFFSKVLSFFFGLQKTGDNVSRASICDAQPIMTLGSHEIDRRNFDRWSTLIFDWNISLKIPYVFKSICVF